MKVPLPAEEESWNVVTPAIVGYDPDLLVIVAFPAVEVP